MSTQEALDLVKKAIVQVAPDADLSTLALDDEFRDDLELDSLDFLSFVETLSDLSGYRIEEDDYRHLTTLAGAAAFLATRM